MRLFKMDDTIETEKKILKSIFAIINELNSASQDLILDNKKNDFFNLRKLTESRAAYKFVNIIHSLDIIKEMLNHESQNSKVKKLVKFIEKLESRVKIYHDASTSKSFAAANQYSSFASKLHSCLTDAKPPSLNSYFSSFYAVIPPAVPKTHPQHNLNAAYYLEKSRKEKITAKTIIGIGISFLALGVASIAFCPPLAITAGAIGIIMIASAGLYLADSMPNVDKIKKEEKEIFELGQQLHAVEKEPANCQQGNSFSMSAYDMLYG